MFIAPLDVIRVLNRAKISFVLVGFHGVGAWMDKPRATEDVDVIVASRHHKKAIQALRKAFPRLAQEDYPVVTRFRDPETRKVAIDVIKPNQQLFREAVQAHEENRDRGSGIPNPYGGNGPRNEVRSDELFEASGHG